MIRREARSIVSASSRMEAPRLVTEAEARSREQLLTGQPVGTGAGGRSRTLDLRITNALLYQLSYTGVPARII